MKYKNYVIAHNPKPIPDRSNDYDFAHWDYDGHEDGRCGNGSSVQDCKQQIDEMSATTLSVDDVLRQFLRGTECSWCLADDEMNAWDTACDATFYFVEGGPEENKFEFCCYCGCKLAQRIDEVEDDD